MSSDAKTKKASFYVPTQKNIGRLKETASVVSDGHSKKSHGGLTQKSLASSLIKKPITSIVISDKASSTGHSERRVLNDAGEDVTPKPLLHLIRSLQTQGIPNILVPESSGGTPTDILSQTSMYQTGGTATASTFGAGPFMRSVFSASESGKSGDSFSDEFGDTLGEMDSSYNEMKIEYKRDEVPETLTEEDLNREVNLLLTETPTIWLLDMPGTSVMTDSEEAADIIASNERYQELTKSRVGNDRYMERSMNTFNEPLKNKHMQTNKVSYSDACVNASQSDMYDVFNKDKPVGTEEDEEAITLVEPDAVVEKTEDDAANIADPNEGPATSKVKVQAIDDSHGTTISSVGALDSIFGKRSDTPGQPGEAVVAHDSDAILKSESLKRHLVVMERVINVNTYQAKQAQYRGYPTLPDIDLIIPPPPEGEKMTRSTQKKVEVVPDLGPSLERLWSYQCPLTKGHNVSCIAWNRVNPDLVAIGYGQYEYAKQKGGLVCCWSIKNPEYPERIYPTAVGVTSVDFSQAHPNLLAAGMYDGTIAIYSVLTDSGEPILDSFDASGKHTGPVWQLKWIEKDRGSSEEKTEVLVSVSTDGRVTQWSIRKGFESYDLMKMKRVFSKQSQAKAKKSEAYISKYAGGLCFDFNTKDSNIYLVGTEDGHIHRCSCSYNEQYLDNYFAHTGPVYNIQWSPFDHNIFLSCSADWSIRLWHQDKLQPILNLYSSTKTVSSVCWSPYSSTVLACVNEGSLEVWDLSQNTLDPILLNTPSTSDTKLASVSFARNSECILVGDCEGQVTVYQLRGMPAPPSSQVDALQQVINASLASQLKN